MQTKEMETLNKFMDLREKKILELTQKATEEIVRRETSLIDFELLLAANITKEESERLTKESRSLRRETWNKLSEKFNGSTDKIQAFANNF